MSDTNAACRSLLLITDVRSGEAGEAEPHLYHDNVSKNAFYQFVMSRC